MRNKILPLILLFSCVTILPSIKSSAQNKAKTESREMYFRITAVKKITNDSIIAEVDGGKKFGIILGSTGPVKGNNKYKDRRSLLELGFSSVIELNDTSSIISIKPVDKTGTNADYDIRKGDYVQLNIKIPVLDYHSIFFEFALLDCQFTNLSKQPLYSFEYLLYNDSKKVEDSILNAAAADVIATYEALKNMDTSYDMLRVPLTAGRYKGRSIFDVMKYCTAKDIIAFLNFAMNYKGSYMGITFKVNETFATWVMNKALFSKGEVKDTVLAYAKKPLLLKAFIEKNTKEIIKEGFINSWIADAGNAKDEAFEELMYVAYLTLQHLPNDTCYGNYYNAKVNRFYDKNEYAKALKYCDTATSYFMKSKNYNDVIVLKNLRGNCFLGLKNYDKALEWYEDGYQMLQNPAYNISQQDIKRRTAYYNRIKGYVYNLKGDLKPSVLHYEQAVSMYKEFNNFEDLKTATILQTDLAAIYKKQGEFLKASKIYNQQLELYTKLNDKKNI
ncbi:MAG: tetratricopeptide repeat protein, partial [Cytophagales bacterium]|nr:tetratricopeptide repeat protein [Cytophaga sp.]